MSTKKHSFSKIKQRMQSLGGFWTPITIIDIDRQLKHLRVRIRDKW